MTTLELSEEFDDSAGRFVNYDAYEASDRFNIGNQKHADIRVFENRETVGGLSVLTLSTETMSTLSPQTMDDISSAVTQIGEGWTTGVVASDPSRNNWRGITIDTTGAENVTESIQLDRPVDIVTNFDGDDFISIALPDYTDQLDKSKTYLELFSISDGIEKVSRLSFSQSILPLTVGDMEFRAPRKELVGDADLSNIVGVRIRYVAILRPSPILYPSPTLYPSTTLYPSASQLKIMAIRILAKSWQYSKLDFDTHYNTFRHSVTPNANLNYDVSQMSPVSSITNLITNPSFETDLAGWTSPAAITRTRSANWSWRGGWSMRLQGAVGAAQYLGYVTLTGADVRPGEQIGFRLTAKVAANPGGLRPYMQMVNTAGTVDTVPYQAMPAAPRDLGRFNGVGEWEWRSIATVPPDTGTVYLLLAAVDGGTADVYIDASLASFDLIDRSVRRPGEGLDVPPFGDPDGPDWEWLGTPNASQSRRKVNNINWVRNPSGEVDASLAATSAGANATIYDSATRSVPTRVLDSTAPSGATALEWQLVADPFGQAMVFLGDPAALAATAVPVSNQEVTVFTGALRILTELPAGAQAGPILATFSSTGQRQTLKGYMGTPSAGWTPMQTSALEEFPADARVTSVPNVPPRWTLGAFLLSGLTPGATYVVRTDKGLVRRDHLGSSPASVGYYDYFDGDSIGGTWAGNPHTSLSILAPTLSAFDLPIIWRSNLPSGENTPRPINAKFGTIFNTGKKVSINSITNYFRELTEDYLTQLDIDGEPQSYFNNKVQPDVGEAKYNPRTQSDLEPFSQATLEEQTQFWLERTPDFFSASWIEFKCQWSSSGDQVTITNTEMNGYTLPISPALEPNKEYVFFTELEDNSVRAIIYPLEIDGSIQNKKVFDSTLITDDTTFPRRKGRFGWRTELNDYSAYIKAIRSHGVTYAEYRSLPFESFTPVRGAELFTDTIPHKELFTGFSVGPFNDSTDTTVDRDKSQSISGESFRITTRGNKTQQGVTSNAFKVENFDETKIELNLYRALDVELNALLINNETQRVISFVLPKLAVNQWQRIILNIPNQPILAGKYKFAILQPDAIPAIWWVDNVSVYERSISWAGRAVVDDPWKNNIAPWTPYKDFVNQDNSGVLFAERGNQLQIRARALQQNTRISRVQFKPLYAQLGRLVWPENEIQGAHLTSIDSTVAGKGVRLSYTVVSGNNSIVLAEWNLGDGTYRVGSVVDYTYDQAGTYTVSLITTDKDGYRNIATQQITIT